MSMLSSEYRVVRPVLENAGIVNALQNLCDIAEYGEPDTDLEDLLAEWAEIDLEQSAWLIYHGQQMLAGYVAVSEDEGDFSLDFYAHPDHNIASHLLYLCEIYIQNQRDPTADTEVTTIVSHVNQTDIAAVQNAGFQPDIYYFRMQIELDAPPFPPAFPRGAVIKTFTETNNIEMVYDFIQNAFDRPGYSRPPFGRWCDFMMRPDQFDSDLWFTLMHNGHMIGAALCYDFAEHGWVRQLGVSPAWRRQGVGSALLHYVFGVFYQRGQSKIALGVNSVNGKAYQLYENAGMERVRQFDQYRKVY